MLAPKSRPPFRYRFQREEMAHRNRVALMGEMTASFAHELNQPLTAIANNASAARRFLERGNLDPVLLPELLQQMVADSHRAGEVIRGIRSLVRKETSEQTLVDLNSVINDTVHLVSSDILIVKASSLQMWDPHLPQVQAALVQIQQVLLNLIMNAPRRGREQLPPSERRVVIKYSLRQGRCGRSQRARLWNWAAEGSPGQSVRSIFYHEATGMGMGLPIVRSIVEAQRGHDHGGEPARSRRAHGCSPAGSSWPRSKEQSGRYEQFE